MCVEQGLLTTEDATEQLELSEADLGRVLHLEPRFAEEATGHGDYGPVGELVGTGEAGSAIARPS